MPLESCQKYTATLSEILALTPAVQTIADATDVPGVRLEWLNGAWYGDCGFPSAGQHAALLAANAYNSLGVGSRAALPSGPVTWRGAGSGGWEVASYAAGSKVAFDFSSTPDGTSPDADNYGQPINIYVPPSAFAADSIIDSGYIRATVSGDTVTRGFYLDTKKHENDISEAGATVKFDAAGITFALCLWKDYTSVIYPTGILTGAAHIRFTTTSISYDVWDKSGVMKTIATSTIAISTGEDHKFLVKFAESTAQVFVDGFLAMTVSDSRISTLGRKVACFEPYQNANVVGYIRIKSGFAESPFYGDKETTVYPLSVRKQTGNASQITVSQTFVDLVGSLSTPHKAVIAILKFPFAQTVAGELLVNFYATTPGGVNTNNIVSANRDVRTGIATVMAYVTGVNGGSVKARIARDASAAATIPVSTYLDHPEMVLIPVQ